MKTIITTTNKDFEGIVKETSRLLEGDNRWRTTFKGYAEEVSKRLNESNYKERGEIEELENYSEEIQIYSSISKVKSSSKRTAYYDLRFRGQRICEVRIKSVEEINLCFTEADIKNNKDHFLVEVEGIEANKHYPINSKPAQDFLSKFKSVSHKDAEGNLRGKSSEHKLESLVLRNTAIRVGDKKLKSLHNMQPIKFGNGFFQMKTAFRASKPEDIKYCIDKRGAATGGGIDILERISKQGVGWRLTVIELKKDTPEVYDINRVMKQALTYATFIAYLLADENCGETWYNIFREQGNNAELHDSIEILVVAMMPKGQKDPTINDEHITLKFKDKTITLIPCTCFLDVDDDFTTIKDAYGSYLDYKKQPKSK